MSFSQLFFSFGGRIGRQTFWIGALSLLLLNVVIAIVDVLAGTQGLVLVLGYLVLLWPNLALTVKRWHDRDKSGWWNLISFIPLIGPLWALVETGFLPGTNSPNRFGSEAY